MGRRTFIIIFSIFGFLLLAETIIFLSFFFHAPKISDEIEPGSHAVHVGLYTPSGNSEWPLNSHIPLSIKIDSNNPIQIIELYINNTLFESRSFTPETQSTTFYDTWHWQPGATGQFIIIVHATDTAGFTGISQPVVISATDGSSSLSPITLPSGQNLLDLSENLGLQLEAIQAANPRFTDPSMVFPEDETVYIPNSPDPITNQKIIQGFLIPEVEFAPLPDFAIDSPPTIELVNPKLPETMEEDSNISPITQNQNFQYWLKNVLSDSNDASDNTAPDPSATEEPQKESSSIFPPTPPVTKADFSGCDVKITLQNTAAYYDPIDPLAINKNEDGFFIYRSRDGGKFERITSWSKIEDFKDVDAFTYTGYSDTNQYGVVTYYIASFNSTAEVPGNPVSIPLNPSTCKKPSRAGGSSPFSETYLDDEGNLVLPFSLDLAYFYIQQVKGNSRTQAWRVPEGNRYFLPESGVKFNLYHYLDTVPALRMDPDLEIELDLWGWSGGALVHAGTYKLSLQRSILLICSVEGEGGCTGNGGGEWLPEINLSTSKPINEQAYEVMWRASSISPIKDVCIQLAYNPYLSEDWWSGISMPIYSFCTNSKKADNTGIYLYELGYILYPSGGKNAGQWGVGMSNIMNFDSNWFQYEVAIGEPFTLFMRAYPRHELSGFNRYTNIGVMHYNTEAQPSELPPLASNLSSIVTVDILEDTYVPPNFEVMADWGCVIIEEDPTGTFQPGQKVCPPLVGESKDDCAGKNAFHCLADAMYDQAMDAYDQMLWVWDLWKTEIAKWLSATLGPWCYNSQECRDLNKKALEYIIQYYTGIPANPPSSDELIAESAADWIVNSAIEMEKYYTEQDVSAIEALCEIEKCKEKIKEKLKEELKTQRSQASQPACTSSYQAYFMGKEPMCLNPSIIVHPAPGGGNYPAMVGVKITRKVDFASLGVQKSDLDKYMVDITVTAENTFNNDAISGPLYYTARLNLPWIEPGESFVMTTVLLPCSYDLKMPGCTGGTNYYGFEALYFDASSTMKAVEMCYSTDSSWAWVPCTNGGSDTWSFKNPPDKSTLEVGQP
ncbi:MAG: hypothetical protein CVU42_16675 [Chloroflexi bacterium HGW-Chloroflexi-4]|jgi:hypothetical protein|nr:MAG: hypothetical protein CVU42_16675 [Chloroflexi bacterium HGW-Chloroflexi-4]